MKGESNYLNPNTLNQLSAAASNYMKLQLTNYLYKTSKIFNSDINEFGTKVLSKFTTYDDYENYNWLENYQNAFFNVNVNVNVRSGFIITES